MQRANLTRAKTLGTRLARSSVARFPLKRAATRPVTLPGSSAGQAFELIALSCIDRFRRDQARLGQTGSAEDLHRVRVALRRLRSAFSIFAPVVDDPRFETWTDELRWLAATSNKARDLDVLIGQFESPPPALTDARERAFARATRALASPRARKLMIELNEALERGVRFGGEGPAHFTAARFAAAALDRLRRKVRRKGRHLRRLDDAELHELRIAAKKLRYATELFAALYPKHRAKRRQKRFLEALRALQDRLGALQDRVVAPALLERLGIPAANWPSFPGRKRLVRRAKAPFEKVRDARPFWR